MRNSIAQGLFGAEPSTPTVEYMYVFVYTMGPPYDDPP